VIQSLTESTKAKVQGAKRRRRRRRIMDFQSAMETFAEAWVAANTGKLSSLGLPGVTVTTEPSTNTDPLVPYVPVPVSAPASASVGTGNISPIHNLNLNPSTSSLTITTASPITNTSPSTSTITSSQQQLVSIKFPMSMSILYSTYYMLHTFKIQI
jgi:hypothetical protein